MLKTAVKSTANVSSLLPSTVRDRLYAKKDDQDISMGKKRLKKVLLSVATAIADALSGDDFTYKIKAIADLFPTTTVLFADVSGTYQEW